MEASGSVLYLLSVVRQFEDLFAAVKIHCDEELQGHVASIVEGEQ